MSVSPRCAGSSSVAKPGPERRDLEEDAVRLAEVDRAEPEAVDHVGRAAAGLGDALPPALLVLHRRRPGDVMHGAGAGNAGLGRAPPRTRSSLRASRRASPSDSPPARSRAASKNGAACCAESRAYARTPSKPCSASSRGISGWSAISGSSGAFVTTSWCCSPSGSLNVSVSPSRATPSRSAQKSSASAEPTRQTTVCTMPAPARPGAAPGILEEGDVRAGRALLVRVEEVVDGRVVLVDRLLHEPQPEHAGVEVDVRRGVAGDAGHVVDAVESHRYLRAQILAGGPAAHRTARECQAGGPSCRLQPARHGRGGSRSAPRPSSPRARPPSAAPAG